MVTYESIIIQHYFISGGNASRVSFGTIFVWHEGDLATFDFAAVGSAGAAWLILIWRYEDGFDFARRFC